MDSPNDAIVADTPRNVGSERIGTMLRRLRGDRNLSIAHLAKLAGVSAGIISQIERGNSNPSIKTLQRLRAVLGVNLWEVLGQPVAADAAGSGTAEADGSGYVQRKADRPRIVVGASRLVKELLSPRRDRNLRFMLITLPPGGESEDVIMGEGEKGGLVLDGRIDLVVGSTVTSLEEGDSFQFPSTLPHKICNPSSKDANIVWIMSMIDSHI